MSINIKISQKLKFSIKEDKMKHIGNVILALDNLKKIRNLYFLIKNRFDWMNNFIELNKSGIEVGAAAGFSKVFTKNKSILITDFCDDAHLDIKNLDAQKTDFKDESFDYVIASNMIHHIPYPMKFFHEMHRIIKKNGKHRYYITKELVDVIQIEDYNDREINIFHYDYISKYLGKNLTKALVEVIYNNEG